MVKQITFVLGLISKLRQTEAPCTASER